MPTAIETKLVRSTAVPRRVRVARIVGLLSVALFIGAFWSLVLILLSTVTGMSTSTSIFIGSLIGLFCGLVIGVVMGRQR